MNTYKRYVTAEEAHPAFSRPQDTAIGRALLAATHKAPGHSVAKLQTAPPEPVQTKEAGK